MVSSEFLINKLPKIIQKYEKSKCELCGHPRTKFIQYYLKIDVLPYSHLTKDNKEIMSTRYKVYYKANTGQHIGENSGLGYKNFKSAVKDLIKILRKHL